MKLLIYGVALLGTSAATAAIKDDCLNGKFSACQAVFNTYGSQSNRVGAVELFDEVCSSQSLKVTCRVVSSSKNDTLKKTLEIAMPGAGAFVINGAKIDKIYQVSEVK